MTRRVTAVLITILALVAGCTGGAGEPESNPSALRILAGSELADLAPLLEEAAAELDIEIELHPDTGSLDGAELVASGQAESAYDAIWFSSNRYLSLLPEAQGMLGPASDVMSSPVVLGLRRSAAERLGWLDRPPTWSQIAAAAGADRFSYAMTDPSASNTGFSTVVAVATALANTGSALTVEQAGAATPGLKEFYSAQRETAGSSGFLQEKFARCQGEGCPDGMFNYESVLLGMAGGPDPIEVIHPADGVITADYPLTALNAAAPEKKDALRRLTDHLRSPAVQQRLADTHRRPAVAGAAGPSAQSGVELPFPSEAQVVDTLLTSYFDELRRPSRTIYVLDTSGSMEGDERIGALRRTLVALAGGDSSITGRFRKFRAREEVTLLPFASTPGSPQTYVVSEENPDADRQQIASAAQGLQANGGTAIFSSVLAAYDFAAEQVAADPDRFTSIVLMTDGENTEVGSLYDLQAFWSANPQVHGVPTFCVVFGESNVSEMEQIAQLTGGETFDARTAPLSEIFKEIRGYV